MANEHIFNNSLIITGSVTSSVGFSGDGSGLTGITATAEWDGSRNGDASITGSLIVSSSNATIDFTNTGGVSGSFSGSYQGNGLGLTNLNLNGYQASGSNISGSFSGSFQGNGSNLTDLNPFPFSGNAIITGSIIASSSIIDFTDAIAISGSLFSGSFQGDGSGLTNLPTSEWDGSRNGDASITGSFTVSGSAPTIQLLGETKIDKNISISNRGSNKDLGIGYFALPDSTQERKSIGIGYLAGTLLQSGSCNIYIGCAAGLQSVKTSGNIGIGNQALRNSTGLDSGNVSIACNLAIGHSSALNITTGRNNTAIGHASLYYTETSLNNTAVGYFAGFKVKGTGNTLMGYQTGLCVDTGQYNVLIGANAGQYLSGGYNTAVGSAALLGVNSNLTTGTYNTAVGRAAGRRAIGNSNRNVYIGNCAGPSSDVEQNYQLYIGQHHGETPLIRGDFNTGVLTINSCLKVAEASGSFVGDGSGLTGISGAGFPYAGTAKISGSLAVSQSTAAGTAVTIENGHTILAQVSESLEFDNDTLAAAGGVPLGGLYRSGNFIAIRLT